MKIKILFLHWISKCWNFDLWWDEIIFFSVGFFSFLCLVWFRKLSNLRNKVLLHPQDDFCLLRHKKWVIMWSFLNAAILLNYKYGSICDIIICYFGTQSIFILLMLMISSPKNSIGCVAIPWHFKFYNLICKNFKM